ncbi:MAG TPA: fatty acid oxidation complex subunit alpha FadJ [Anaeromyxobacter sp.]|nr:fatty acid oxidation complex subunit alpha FadJ [Anaeromyxobacter sp.]
MSPLEAKAESKGTGENFRVDVVDGVLTLLLDVPGETVNVLGSGVAEEFEAALSRAAADPALNGVVLASGKKDSFVAGARIGEFQRARTAADAEKLSRAVQAAFDRLEAYSKPVVAAIHGACLGGGLEWSLACTWRIAADDPRTRLGLPETQLGVIPGGGGTQRLPRLVGLEAALDMICAARSVKARRALRMGLVDEVVPPALLLEVARRRARELAEGKVRRQRRTSQVGERLAHAALEGNAVGRALLFRRAREAVRARTRGHYPAPLRAIDAVEHGVRRGKAAGLVVEARIFGELAVSPTAQRLMEIFFAQTALKKDSGVDLPGVKARPVTGVGILGGGFMGSGIALVTAQAGLPVRIRERDDAAAARALGSVRAALDERVKKHSLDKLERDEKMRLVTATTDLGGFERVEVAIEAVFEDLSLKREMVRAFEAVNPKGIFASNTSSIPIAEIALASAHPETVLGMHYFSPVPRMPLLEVIGAPKTAPEAIATAVDLGKRQGKTVIVVRDGPGFYTSRILTPYVNEAVRILLEGARIEEVDRALTAFGFPVGPLTLLDEVGIDVADKVGKILYAAFGERMAPPEALHGVLATGRLGRKSRKGFYTYDGKRKRVDETIYALLPGGGTGKPIPPAEIGERVVLQMVNEAILCLGENVLRSARDGDLGAVFGLGFPPFRGGPFRHADALGTGALLEAMRRLEEKHGPRFAPAPFLLERGTAGRPFHPA